MKPERHTRGAIKILCLCALLISSGCATRRTLLINSKGDVLSCETSGYGFFGAISVRNQHQECVAEAEKRGYRAMD